LGAWFFLYVPQKDDMLVVHEGDEPGLELLPTGLHLEAVFNGCEGIRPKDFLHRPRERLADLPREDLVDPAAQERFRRDVQIRIAPGVVTEDRPIRREAEVQVGDGRR